MDYIKPANAIEKTTPDDAHGMSDTRGMTFKQCYGKYQPRKTCGGCQFMQRCQIDSKGWW